MKLKTRCLYFVQTEGRAHLELDSGSLSTSFALLSVDCRHDCGMGDETTAPGSVALGLKCRRSAAVVPGFENGAIRRGPHRAGVLRSEFRFLSSGTLYPGKSERYISRK